MDWKEVLSTFVTVFLTALAPVLASIVTAWVLQQYKLVRARMSKSQLEWLDMVASFAVLAAEQAKVANLVGEKRDYAIAIVEAQLAKYGYTFDVDVIEAAIEKAVFEELNRYKNEPAEA